jgi:hypothetical protein
MKTQVERTMLRFEFQLDDYIYEIFPLQNSVVFSPQVNHTDRRLPLFGDLSANFAVTAVSRGQCDGSPRSLISVLYTGAAIFSFK